MLAYLRGGSAPAAAGAGVRSMFAFWMGGASYRVPPTTSGGRRSMLAFWMGGASDIVAVAAADERVERGGRFRHWPKKRRVLAFPARPSPSLPATLDEIEDLIAFFDLL